MLQSQIARLQRAKRNPAPDAWNQIGIVKPGHEASFLLLDKKLSLDTREESPLLTAQAYPDSWRAFAVC